MMSPGPFVQTRVATRHFRRLAVPALLFAWAVLTAGAFGWLNAYTGAPGAQHPAPAVSSDDNNNRYSLHLFLHPKCPCSRATLGELARLAARAGDRLTTHVHFILPDGATDDWRRTALYDAAEAISGVTVAADPGGADSARYGAATSGQAVLYTPDGRLAFAGGITSSRGHEGDNDGAAAILEIVSGRQPSVTKTPVFGCALFDEDQSDGNAATDAGPTRAGKGRP